MFHKIRHYLTYFLRYKPYGFVAPDAKIWFQKFQDTDEFGNELKSNNNEIECNNQNERIVIDVKDALNKRPPTVKLFVPLISTVKSLLLIASEKRSKLPPDEILTLFNVSL